MPKTEGDVQYRVAYNTGRFNEVKSHPMTFELFFSHFYDKLTIYDFSVSSPFSLRGQ